MKNNKEGFATLGLAMAVLIIASILMISFSNPMLNTTRNIKGAEESTKNYVGTIAGKERLHSKLKENVSYRGDLIFEDIDTSYNIRTLNEEYESEHLVFNQGDGSFEINNETDINISISATSIDSKLNHSYDVSIMYNNKDIIGNSGKSLSGNNNIKVGKDFSYNPQDDKVNYGNYNLIITSNNSDVSADVKYTRLVKREIEVSDKNFNEVIVIENEEIGNNNVTNLYYK